MTNVHVFGNVGSAVIDYVSSGLFNGQYAQLVGATDAADLLGEVAIVNDNVDKAGAGHFGGLDSYVGMIKAPETSRLIQIRVGQRFVAVLLPKHERMSRHAHNDVVA